MAMIKTCKMPVLQTKSASGAVATFNTTLAMPLASCKIAINAWQEGSGDPSPVNNRPIHGFSVLNATRAGKNLANIAQEAEKRKNGEFLFTLVYEGSKVTIETSTMASLYVVWGLFQIPKSFVGVTVTLSNSSDGGVLYLCRATNADYSGIITDLTSRTVKTYTFSDSDVGSYLGIRFINATGSDKYIENVQLEIGSTATDYEPYVTPTIYPIQLGQEVYGAEVDVVNGVARVTWGYLDLGVQTWNKYSADYFYTTISDIKLPTTTQERVEDMMCTNYAPSSGYSLGEMTDKTYLKFAQTENFWIRDNDYSDATAFKNDMNGVYLAYKIAEPFDIQLTPTQIETLIGNNTIFADTGDVDLTFKDLDIAKRGNFREVFKLP